MRVGRSVNDCFGDALAESFDTFHTTPDSLSDDLAAGVAFLGLECLTKRHKGGDIRSPARPIKEVGRACLGGLVGRGKGCPKGSGVDIGSSVLARVGWVEGDDEGSGRH